MSGLSFFVPGAPVGKGRPRDVRAGARGVRMYTPDKTAAYEALVALAARHAMAGRSPIPGAVAVDLEIVVPIPASWSGSKQRSALAGALLPTTKPDVDNVEKAVFDALNAIAWVDDVQVVDVTKSKRYGASPGVAVRITELEAA